MEGEESRPTMGDGGGVLLTKPALSRPPLALPLPPRSDDNASPSGHMSLVPATFIAKHDPDSQCCGSSSSSSSQLLAGAMASPPPKDKGSPPSSAAGHVDRGTTSSAKFKCAPPSRIPIPRSAFLSLPQGLSPSTLLDSPMLLSNAQVEPSPTTGNFPLVPVKEESSELESGSSFVFKPFAKLGSSSSRSTSLASPVEAWPTAGSFPLVPVKEESLELENRSSFVFKPFAKLGNNSSQSTSLAQVQAKAHIQAQTQAQAQAHGQVQVHATSGPSCDASSIATSLPLQVASSTLSSSSAAAIVTNCVATPAQLKPQSQLETTQIIASSELVSQNREQNQRALPPISPVPVMERPSADGYNWRKYGQKQVKGSECPRSYYKCTYVNCPVKKKVERLHDGQIREIVYKGEHNHPKPQPTRRMAVVSHHHTLDGRREAAFPAGRFGIKNETLDAKANGSGQVLSGDPSGHVSDPSTSLKIHDTGNVSPVRSCGSSDDQGEDGNKLNDGDHNEPDSKRIKKDKNAKDIPAIPQPRTIREPRVVVQTRSDVDILDDGYRWRKYGQKVVKGSPHPRSYYKCTNLGCPVRKHVERASNDVKAVITTYEGKHNHDVPAAKNSSHDAVGANSQVQTENSAASGSSVTNAVHGQQIGSQLSAFGRISENRAEGGDSIKTGNGGVTESVPAICSDGHYGGRNVETSIVSSVTLSVPLSVYPISMVMSFGSGDNVNVSGMRPKEEH